MSVVSTFIRQLAQHINFEYSTSTGSTYTFWKLNVVDWIYIQTLNSVCRLVQHSNSEVLCMHWLTQYSHFDYSILGGSTFIFWILYVDWLNIYTLNTIPRLIQHSQFVYCTSAGSAFILWIFHVGWLNSHTEFCTLVGSRFILWMLYVRLLSILRILCVGLLNTHILNTVRRLSQHLYSEYCTSVASTFIL